MKSLPFFVLFVSEGGREPLEPWTTEVPNATSRLMGRSSCSLEDSGA